MVELQNNSKKDFKAQWDGQPFVIRKGKSKDVVRGLAEHFIELYPNAGLEIVEIEEEEPEAREPVNPLEEANRGKAFEELE